MAEYYRMNPGLITGRGASIEAQEFFKRHDAAHVVFGCGTALRDEAIVKIASIFGTSGGFGVLRGYRLHESQQIYQKLAKGEMLATALHSLILAPRTLFRCLRQHHRWPWDNFDRYLNVSLCDIRKEFGIRVAHGDYSREVAFNPRSTNVLQRARSYPLPPYSDESDPGEGSERQR
jgi:hypothetical protein